jgi:hypothetical protein
MMITISKLPDSRWQHLVAGRLGYDLGDLKFAVSVVLRHSGFGIDTRDSFLRDATHETCALAIFCALNVILAPPFRSTLLVPKSATSNGRFS